MFQLVVSNYEAIVDPVGATHPDVEYEVRRCSGSELFCLIRRDSFPLDDLDPGELLFEIEKDITVELQKRRPDLYFLHAAALEWKGKACLLAADSGGGKSTTTWALLHHGFRYLSDELSPVDPESLQVFPYPHALCLKQRLPDYPLPANTIDLRRTLHVPVRSLPSATITEPLQIGAVFLVTYRPDLKEPELRAISPAEAAARLYLNVLNALSHPNRGLDAAVRIAEHVPCFAVHSAADLRGTCTLMRAALAA